MSGQVRETGSQAGFSLVEVLVASVLLIVGVVGMLAIFPQAFRNTTNSGREAVLNHLTIEKVEKLRGLALAHADLTVGVHPAQVFDSAGQRYYPVSGFDEDISLRWQVSAGPADGTGTAEPDIRTIIVEATYRVRYTAGGAPITGDNSLEASFGTLLTD